MPGTVEESETKGALMEAYAEAVADGVQAPFAHTSQG